MLLRHLFTYTLLKWCRWPMAYHDFHRKLPQKFMENHKTLFNIREKLNCPLILVTDEPILMAEVLRSRSISSRNVTGSEHELSAHLGH